MSTRRIRVIISGKVQGVFFRVSLRDRARDLGISGWARNTSDGDVEALLEGDPMRLDEIISWCWRGPPGATVDNVSQREESAGPNRSSFEIID